LHQSKKKSCKSALLITHKIDYQIVDKTNQLLLPFCRDGFVLSQTEQTHRRFSWSSHRRLTPIFSSATPLPTFFFFFGDGSWTAAGWINAMQLLP
jgi:hypothetical protein